ncbi:hypothetical protein PCASD_17760 [Puccinia coronata f. sp. avenae]|uniref:Uncharacterized protein n=1 Tax=Puccinia coronata f. sp. avenae TaxID=200324 RepID=A0A2N5TYU8_9BASI|nr:hypothetical protein PCASD_17760 [Puccinia coronata f. sp. avenae]
MELIQNDEGEGRVPEFEGMIPKIRRVPHTIVTSPEELIYRQKQFEAAVKANPQAGATASERRSYLIKNWATTESQKKLKLLYKDADRKGDASKIASESFIIDRIEDIEAFSSQ